MIHTSNINPNFNIDNSDNRGDPSVAAREKPPAGAGGFIELVRWGEWLGADPCRLAATAHEDHQAAGGDEAEAQAGERQRAVATGSSQRRGLGGDRWCQDLDASDLRRAADHRVGVVAELEGLE